MLIEQVGYGWQCMVSATLPIKHVFMWQSGTRSFNSRTIFSIIEPAISGTSLLPRMTVVFACCLSTDCLG